VRCKEIGGGAGFLSKMKPEMGKILLIVGFYPKIQETTYLLKIGVSCS
jgi:hypothetical protein